MFRYLNNDKIGNLLVFLASRCEKLCLTKALKLLYIIDETAVKETGVPVTWLNYQAWQHGPVANDIYEEIRSERHHVHAAHEISTLDFIKTDTSYNKKRKQNETFLTAKIDFNDEIFSDYEIQLFQRIIEKYGRLTSNELIELLHKEGSLWDKVVKENNLYKDFELLSGKSEHSIPLYSLNEGDIMKRMAFKSAYESLEFQEQLIS